MTTQQSAAGSRLLLINTIRSHTLAALALNHVKQNAYNPIRNIQDDFLPRFLFLLMPEFLLDEDPFDLLCSRSAADVNILEKKDKELF